ncbi:hypothetical protein Tco_0667743 [Tanacetum coccineum]
MSKGRCKEVLRFTTELMEDKTHAYAERGSHIRRSKPSMYPKFIANLKAGPCLPRAMVALSAELKATLKETARKTEQTNDRSNLKLENIQGSSEGVAVVKKQNAVAKDNVLRVYFAWHIPYFTLVMFINIEVSLTGLRINGCERGHRSAYNVISCTKVQKLSAKLESFHDFLDMLLTKEIEGQELDEFYSDPTSRVDYSIRRSEPKKEELYAKNFPVRDFGIPQYSSSFHWIATKAFHVDSSQDSNPLKVGQSISPSHPTTESTEPENTKNEDVGGSEKMYQDVKKAILVAQYESDFATYVSKCLTSVLRSRPNIRRQSGLLVQPEIPQWMWDNIMMDFDTKLPRVITRGYDTFGYNVGDRVRVTMPDFDSNGFQMQHDSDAPCAVSEGTVFQ